MNIPTLSALLAKFSPQAILLDAYGVLYSDSGPVPGIANALRLLQATAPVFIATNNSYHSLEVISRRLKMTEIHIPPQHIFSSGMGLAFDPELITLLRDKKAYVLGGKTSWSYIEESPIKTMVKHPDDADLIIMTASLSDEVQQQKEQEAIIHSLKKKPRPFICTNPDDYVTDNRGTRIPVCGYYARQIEKESKVPIHWVGKPCLNYSLLIKKWLWDRAKIEANAKVLFVDDNPDNLTAMKSHIGVSTCLSWKTGLSQLIPDVELKKNHPTLDYLIESLGHVH